MQLTIRKITKKDLAALDDIRGEALHALHLKRIEQQDLRELDYFIAFEGKKAIGHVFLRYKKLRDWQREPILEDLYVKDEERQKGYAKEIMKYVERYAQKKGYKTLSLDVETNNTWLIKFYESLGYKRVSGPHNLTWYSEDKEKEEKEIVWHQRKKLDH